MGNSKAVIEQANQRDHLSCVIWLTPSDT